MVEDDRKHPRIAFHLPVEIKGHEGSNKISELSMGGLFVETDSSTEFKTGDQIDMVVRRAGKERPIEARCRVTRVTETGIGVKFVRITLQDAWELIMETEWKSPEST